MTPEQAYLAGYGEAVRMAQASMAGLGKRAAVSSAPVELPKDPKPGVVYVNDGAGKMVPSDGGMSYKDVVSALGRYVARAGEVAKAHPAAVAGGLSALGLAGAGAYAAHRISRPSEKQKRRKK